MPATSPDSGRPPTLAASLPPRNALTPLCRHHQPLGRPPPKTETVDPGSTQSTCTQPISVTTLNSAAAITLDRAPSTVLGPESSEGSSTGMRSETAVRRRLTRASEIERDNGRSFPEVRHDVVGLAAGPRRSLDSSRFVRFNQRGGAVVHPASAPVRGLRVVRNDPD